MKDIEQDNQRFVSVSFADHWTAPLTNLLSRTPPWPLRETGGHVGLHWIHRAGVLPLSRPFRIVLSGDPDANDSCLAAISETLSSSNQHPKIRDTSVPCCALVAVVQFFSIFLNNRNMGNTSVPLLLRPRAGYSLHLDFEI